MSSQIHLTPMEVKDLIRKYKSEMRKLDFQILKIQSTINELETFLPEEDPVIATIQMVDAEGEVKPEAAPAKKGRGRKPKTTAKAAPKTAAKAPAKAAAKPKAKPAKPAKESKKTPPKGKRTRNTKLNEWDQMVMDGVRNAGKALINPDLQDLGMAKIKEENLSMSEDDLKTKLNQTLHKLANNKGLLKKVKYSGRGFAYALPEWFTQKGDLPKKYQR